MSHLKFQCNMFVIPRHVSFLCYFKFRFDVCLLYTADFTSLNKCIKDDLYILRNSSVYLICIFQNGGH